MFFEPFLNDEWMNVPCFWYWKCVLKLFRIIYMVVMDCNNNISIKLIYIYITTNWLCTTNKRRLYIYICFCICTYIVCTSIFFFSGDISSDIETYYIKIPSIIYQYVHVTCRLLYSWAALYVEKGKGDTPKACGKRNKGKKEKEKKRKEKGEENYQNTI